MVSTLRVRGKWRLFRQDAGRVSGPPALLYVALFALCIAIGNWSAARYGAVLLWPANGLLLAAVLQLHRRKAISVLAACFLINVAGNYLRHDPPHLVLLNAVLNLGEVVLAGLVARRFCGAALDLRRPSRLMRFVLLAAFPAVALSALIGVSSIPTPLPQFWGSFQTYFMVETIGILTTTPTLLLLARAHRFADPDEAGLWEKLILMTMLIVITVATFGQSSAPIMFPVFLPLMLIAFRLPPAWSAVSVIIVAIIGGTVTINGQGPISLSTLSFGAAPADVSASAVRGLPIFHLFMCAVLGLSLPASTVLTERRRLDARLRARTQAAVQAKGRAECAAEAKARFLSMMSHEMRTPLNGVAGFAELLAGRADLSDEAHAQVEQIRRSSDRLMILVDDLLDISHGEIELAQAPFSPAAVVRRAVDDLLADAQAKGLTLVVDDALGLEPWFMGDARRVRQLLNHLLSNAVKFTSSGEVEVGVALTSDGFELRVADTGPGLAPDRIAGLFQPFAQADASISRAHEGAGLGLALSRRLAEVMGGQIVAANRPEGGAEFRVRLPAAPAEAPAAEASDPEPRALRVLVVDDHPINREVATVMLGAAGCETAIACDGLEALEAARDGGFDLILMDVRMPRLDGLQATRAIRSLPGVPGDVPILAMTADAMPDDVKRCLDAGMDAHLAKPISQASLWGAMMRVLERAAEPDDRSDAAALKA